MWRSIVAPACFLLALATSSTKAFADDIFTITNGTDTISFTLPASPSSPQTGCGRDPGFCFDSLPITIDGNPGSSTVTFYSNYNSSGLSLTGDYGGNTSGFLVYGFDSGEAALFSGYTSAPTFNLGTYVIYSSYGDLPTAFSGDLTLTITPQTVGATPEPSSVALLGTGLSALAMVSRRRKRARS
jgi:hypothetical protein